MSTSVNIDRASSPIPASPSHAVRGDLRRAAVSHFPRRLGLGVLLFCAACNLAMAGPKLSKDLQAMTSAADIDVIVQFTRIPTSADLQQFTAAQIKDRFQHVKAVHVRVPMAAIKALESNPAVTYITPNRAIKGSLDISTAAVNANQAWQTFNVNGTGVGVAVIDSGIWQHPDLNGANGATRIVYSQSFVPGLNAADQYGHGTHVAGIIGGSGASSTGAGFTRTLKGVAPNVNLINLRVLDGNGSGTDSQMIAALDAAISLESTYNIRVVNMSVGRVVYESYTLDPLCQAAEAAWNAGMVVVDAAGNGGRDNAEGTYGYGTIIAPGNDPHVITVGAMNTNGAPNPYGYTMATFSSKGPTTDDQIIKPDLVAPGNNVVSLLCPNSTLSVTYPSGLVPNSYYQSGSPSGLSSSYFMLSGTSMATPMVSGAAALLIQQNPALTPDQVKALLMATAAKVLPTYSSAADELFLVTYNNQADVFTVGAGLLNVAAALSDTNLATAPALSPSAVMNPLTGAVYMQFPANSVWTSNSAVWGAGAVWGVSAFLGEGNASLWGAATSPWGINSNALNIVWGTSVDGPDPTTLQAFSMDDGDE